MFYVRRSFLIVFFWFFLFSLPLPETTPGIVFVWESFCRTTAGCTPGTYRVDGDEPDRLGGDVEVFVGFDHEVTLLSEQQQDGRCEHPVHPQEVELLVGNSCMVMKMTHCHPQMSIGYAEIRTQNSELYYSRIEILDNSLFLQAVLAKIIKLHRQHI